MKIEVEISGEDEDRIVVAAMENILSYDLGFFENQDECVRLRTAAKDIISYFSLSE